MLEAFYINLDRRVDRRAHIEGQLQRAGVSAERLSASIPGDVPIEWFERQSDSAFKGAFPPLRPAELACTLSHKRVWELMLERGLPAVAVFEDDSVISPLLAKFLSEPKLANTSWYDLIRLETRGRPHALGVRRTTIQGCMLYRLLSGARGSAAYIIPRHTARRLVDSDDLSKMAVDQVLTGTEGQFIYEARVLQVYPALTAPVDRSSPHATSDIALVPLPRSPSVSRAELVLRHLRNGSFLDVAIAAARPRRPVPFAA